MKVKKLIFLILMFIHGYYSNAQEISIEWQKVLGGNNYEDLGSVIKTSDGNLVCFGISHSGISGDKTEPALGEGDYWIIKTDADAEPIWDRTLGGTKLENSPGMLQSSLSTGGYVVIGSSRSDNSETKSEDNIGGFYENDYWIVALDEDGNLIWENTIGGHYSDHPTSIVELADGSLIVGGISESNTSGDKSEDAMGTHDYWVVKLSNTGEVVWDHTIGGSGSDQLTDMCIANDGGILLIGLSSSNISGDKTEPDRGIGFGNAFDYWVVKINDSGEILWDKTIGGSKADYGHKIIPTADEEGYLIAGTSRSSASAEKTGDARGILHPWIVKIDNSGEILWDKSYGGDASDFLLSISGTDDSGFILAMQSNSGVSFEKSEPHNGGAFDAWLLKLDASGDIEWDKTIGADEDDTPKAIIQTEDNGYLLACSSNSSISGDKTIETIGAEGWADFWLVKINDCTALDNTVLQSGITLSANADGYEYQWVDCDNDFEPIEGETDQSFTPDANGNYGVIIKDGVCEKMSDCISITTVELPNYESSQLSVYPNPVSNTLYINRPTNNGKIIITNLLGEKIIESSASEINTSQLEQGIYIVSIYQNDSFPTVSIKITKQ